MFWQRIAVLLHVAAVNGLKIIEACWTTQGVYMSQLVDGCSLLSWAPCFSRICRIRQSQPQQLLFYQLQYD